MNLEDVSVLESLLRRMRTQMNCLLRDSELALELLAATARRPSGRASAHPDTDGLIDETRFVVRWAGLECHLGQTVPFRLFQRLADSVNSYVSHERLLDDVWGGPRTASAIRTAVGELRRRLTESGLDALARAVDGENPGHYGLRLDRINGASDPTENGR